MADDIYVPTDSDSQQYSWMSSVEERLDTLESEARLFRASVKGGAIVAYTDDGKQVARLGTGKYPLPGGITREVPVLSATDPNKGFHLLIDMEDGWVDPKFLYNFVEDTYIPVTSASFISTWKSGINIMGYGLVCRFIATADSGTTGEIKLNLNNGVESDVISLSAGTQKLCEFVWDLEDRVPFNSEMILRVYARRVSGANNINIYAPDRCYTTSNRIFTNISTGGVPT